MIILVRFYFLDELKQLEKHLRQLYLWMHVWVVRTLMVMQVLPDWIVRAWLSRFLALRKTGYWSCTRVPNFDLLSVR